MCASGIYFIGIIIDALKAGMNFQTENTGFQIFLMIMSVLCTAFVGRILSWLQKHMILKPV